MGLLKWYVVYRIATRGRRRRKAEARNKTGMSTVFDLADDVNADAKAEHWAKIIQERMIEARDSVLLRARPLEGETVVTV